MARALLFSILCVVPVFQFAAPGAQSRAADISHSVVAPGAASVSFPRALVIHMYVHYAARTVEPARWPAKAPAFARVLAAMVRVESHGCRRMRGDDGRAQGCLQLHEEAVIAVTGERVSAARLRSDWRLNITLGAAYLARQFRLNRNWRIALARYNRGPSYTGDGYDSYTRLVLGEL